MNPHWLGIFGDVPRHRRRRHAPCNDQIAKRPLAFRRDLPCRRPAHLVQFNTRRMPQTAADASFSSFQHSAGPLNIWVAVDGGAPPAGAGLSITKRQNRTASAAKGAFQPP